MFNRSVFDGGGYYSFRDWLQHPLTHGFSHRRFNLSTESRRGELSLKSLVAFLRPLGIEEARVLIPNQQQSAKIQIVDSSNYPEPLNCDALITETKGLALSILSADCAPLFFYDKINEIIGIAHVGWRGLRDHFPQRMVETIKRLTKIKISSIRIGIGPTIRSCCYEVGGQQEKLFLRHIHYRDGKTFLDLAGAIIEELIRAGIRKEEIADSNICPSCSNDRFFSWRRERTQARMMSVIMMQ